MAEGRRRGQEERWPSERAREGGGERGGGIWMEDEKMYRGKGKGDVGGG